MTADGLQTIDGLAQIQQRYDALLVDAWGVLHDGQRCYPGVHNCLQQLARLGKPVVILSNAARRVDALGEELARVGIARPQFRDLLSSGELCWRALRSRRLAFDIGERGFYLGPERSRSLCQGLGFDWSDDLDDCDFVLNTGAPEGNPVDAGIFEPLLREMLKRGLPMICANPDRIAVRAGEPGISAGAIARLYQRMGATRVIYFGKPGKEIYRRALALLADIDPGRILAVGDGLETDIAGAAGDGLDSLLITAGIHAAELSHPDASVASLASVYGAQPRWVCDLMRWDGEV